MGVRGLFSFLHSVKNLELMSSKVDIPPSPSSPASRKDGGITILVDGRGLWIDLAQLCTRPETLPDAGPLDADASFVDADVIGGDYWKVSCALASLVRTLYERYNVRLVFAIDGKQYSHLVARPTGAVAVVQQQQQADRNREGVRDKRARKRLQVRMHLYDYCDGKADGKISPYDTKLPAPPLSFHQIRCVLQELYQETGGRTAQVAYVGGEVDAEVGVLLKRFGADYVLTNDCDFCVMAGARTLLLSDFPLDTLLSADGAAVQAPTLSLRYFTSTKICEALKVPSQWNERSSGRTVGRAQFRSLTQEELELIASLATNDVPLDAEANRTAPDGPLTFVKALQLVQNVEKGSPEAERDLETRRRTPHIADSQRKFHRLMAVTAVTCSLDESTVAACQELPPSLHPLLRYGLAHKERMPLCHGKFAYLTDLPTFRRLFLASAALLHKKQVHVYDDQTHATTPEVCDVDDTLLQTVDHFFNVDHETEEAQRALLSSIFGQHAQQPKEMDLFFLSCVLRTVQAGLLDAQELRQLAYTIFLTHALRAKGGEKKHGGSSGLFSYVTSFPKETEPASIGSLMSQWLRGIPRKRPNSRVMELGDLFASGFLATYDVFALVCGGASSSTVRALPAPAEVFSGSVLHLVVAADLTSAEKLLRAMEGVGMASKEQQRAAVVRAAEAADKLLTSLEKLPFLDEKTFPFQPSPLTLAVDV